MSHVEYDEYTDYSCSTFTERLARDVETVLHQWHVDVGSDRHFSSSGSVASGSSTAIAAAAAAAHMAPQQQLRSERIHWNLSFYYTPPSDNNNKHAIRIHCDLELQLTLWDGPPPLLNKIKKIKNGNQGIMSMINSTDDDDDDETQPLPFAVRRRPIQFSFNQPAESNRRSRAGRLHSNTTMETVQDNGNDEGDWLENFSILFGIGQHITLTPLNPLSFCESDKPLNPSYKLLLEYLTHSVLQRHGPAVSAYEDDSSVVMSILSTWLQTALNLAVSHCDCQFPVFGIWGRYHPCDTSATTTTATAGPPPPVGTMAAAATAGRLSVYPSWMIRQSGAFPSALSAEVVRDTRLRQAKAGATSARRRSHPRSHAKTTTFTHSLAPPLVPQEQPPPPPPILSGHLWCSDVVSANFWCCVLPPTTSTVPYDWTVWGDVLKEHCGGDDGRGSDEYVQLWKARHTYAWCKQRPVQSLLWQALVGNRHHREAHEWRQRTTTTIIASRALQPAAGSSSIHAIDLTRDQYDEMSVQAYSAQCQRYALKLLERAAGSSDEEPVWGPPEDPLESMHLQLSWTGTGAKEKPQPLLTLPLQNRHKMNLPDWQEMLDATESAILDPHRPSVSMVKVYYDNNVALATLAATQRCVLAALIRTATLPKETLLSHLTDESLMERWDAAAGNRIAGILSKKSRVDATTRALVTAMDWNHAASEIIERWQAEDIVRRVLDSSPALGFPSPPDSAVAALVETNIHSSFLECGHTTTGAAWTPLRKGAPPGRLLSLLFVHMARVRSPSSMALVWTVFVQELRRRWDARESLPNMNYVPGLDPSPHAVCSSSTSTTRQCFSSVGAKANLAAQVHSSEPDPDDWHCLIGQKLQVFNLGLESVISSDIRQVEQLEKRPRLDELNISPHNIPKASKTLLNGSIVDGLPMVDAMDIDRDDSKSLPSQEFYDAEDTESIVFRSLDSGNNGLTTRKGARCPVQGVNLSTGDQLYAPYLQRPFPLTDDIIAERRIVLMRQNSGRASTTIRQRLEIVQRFQKPKLHSDMRSFKAANPGAIFEDFISWYGNPSDPLVDIKVAETLDAVRVTSNDTTADKLKRANEAIWALEQTRNFWIKTWEEAASLPAFEQEALFDAESTVEMAIDYLENIHPATLLCQVVAVNLSMAYFTLAASAGETINVRSVRASLGRLREKTDEALKHLASDAVMLTDNIHKNRANPDMMASVEAIAACAKACESLTAAEVILARAASLLHKLPQQYSLVERLMQMKEGTPIRDSGHSGRSTFLETVHEQQKRLPTAGIDLKLKPAIREYLLRNMDDSSPCQLCVRSSDEGIKAFGADGEGTVLALTKIIKEIVSEHAPVAPQHGHLSELLAI